jgi:hypothetical protein
MNTRSRNTFCTRARHPDCDKYFRDNGAATRYSSVGLPLSLTERLIVTDNGKEKRMGDNQKERRSEYELRSALISQAAALYGAKTPEGTISFDLALSNAVEAYVGDFGDLIARHAKPSPKNANLDVSNQIEDLMEQSARLLDRCLIDKAAYDELSVQRFNTRIEIGQLEMLEAINKAQREDLDYIFFSKREASREGKVLEEMKKAHMPDNSFSDVEDAIKIAHDQAKSRVGAYNVTGPEKDQWHVTHSNLAAEYSRSQSAKTSLEERIRLQEYREKFFEKEARFEIDKQEIGSRTLALKLFESTRSGGALHFTERMNSLVKRASRDFAEAYQKLEALKDGLKQVANIDEPLQIGESGRPLDDAVSWLRDASNRYSRFALLDQRFIHRLVLSFSKAAKPPKIQFNISPDNFPTFTRLVGISAYCSKPDYSFVSLLVRTPPHGSLPPLTCRLGRVGPPVPGLPADVGGMPRIKNRSPFGDWTIEIALHDPRRIAPDEIFFDLHLIGQQ